MHMHPDDERALRAEFDRLLNPAPVQLRAWLEAPESKMVGMTRRGECESVGRQSGKRILRIRAKPVADVADADDAHIRKVIGYCRRHLASAPTAASPTLAGAGA